MPSLRSGLCHIFNVDGGLRDENGTEATVLVKSIAWLGEVHGCCTRSCGLSAMAVTSRPGNGLSVE